jgi:sugar lactone lactonase YvrE
LDSIHDALLFNLNDVVAVSAHEFYVTTDHASIAPPHSQTAQLIETALHGTRAWLSYCDVKTKLCKAALQHIEYPNGTYRPCGLSLLFY